MNPRIAAAVGLLALLLGTIGYLVLFHEPQYVSPEPERGETGGGGTVGTTRKAVPESKPAEATREVLSKAEIGAVETVRLDPFFEKSLSGFKGRILDHEKQPAPQKVIRFYRTDPSAAFHNPGLFHLGEDVTHAMPKMEIKETRTDAGGRFLITGAWPGTFYIYEADADGEQVTRCLVQRVPGPGEIVDLGDIVLQLHGVIVGRVEDENGEPVAGALVRAADIAAHVPVATMAAIPLERFDIDGAMILRGNQAPLVIEFPAWARTYYEMVPIPKTRTNVEGEFRLTNVMPGMNVLVVNAKSLLPHVLGMVKVKSGQEKDVKTIRLKEGELVDGRVVDEEGKPVVGAEVILANKSLTLPVDFAGRHGPTDAEGRFSGSGFRPGEVMAAARTGPGEPWIVVGPTSETANLVIKLPSEHSLTVRLKTNRATPIEKVSFKLLPSHGYNDVIDIGTMGLVRWIDVDKRTEKLKDGRFRIKGLRKGRYDLAVHAKGHGVGRLKFELKDNLESEIQLQGQTPFLVLATDSLGNPVQNALVYAGAHRNWNERSELLHDMPLLCGRTDKEGKLMVGSIQQGEVRLTATHPAYGNAHKTFKTPDLAEIKVSFATPGTITGLLTENGSRPTPGKWTVLAMRRWDGVRGAMPDLPKMQVPDFQGEFEIKGLTPGKYRVHVIKSVDAVTSPGGMFPYIQRQMMGGDPPYVETVIAAGATAHVVVDTVKQPEVLTGPKARIQGTILLNGRPGAGMVVSGWAGRRFTVTADAAGRFDLGERKAGNWISFEVRKPEDVDIFSGRRNGALYSFGRHVKDGEDLSLNIVIETGGASGTVFGTDGYAAKNVRVRASGVIPPRNKEERTTSINQSAETDAQGRFEFETLPAGAYTFEVRGKEGFGVTGKVDVTAGLGTPSLVIKLASVYEVSGRVDMAFFGDKKPDWMWMQVQLQRAGAGPTGVSVDKKDGSFRIRDLGPGSYTVRLWAPGYNTSESRLVADPFEVVNQDVKNLVLAPKVKQEPKPEPKPKKGEKK